MVPRALSAGKVQDRFSVGFGCYLAFLQDVSDFYGVGSSTATLRVASLTLNVHNSRLTLHPKPYEQESPARKKIHSASCLVVVNSKYLTAVYLGPVQLCIHCNVTPCTPCKSQSHTKS